MPWNTRERVDTCAANNGGRTADIRHWSRFRPSRFAINL
jgi:hypothetical protein